MSASAWFALSLLVLAAGVACSALPDGCAAIASIAPRPH